MSLFLSLASGVAAAPTFQAAGTAASGTGGVNPAWPTHAVDDIALLFVESGGSQAVSFSNAQGFVEVPDSPQTSNVSTSAGTRLTVFWARATSSSMAAPSISDPGDHVYARILTYRGVTPSGNPWDVTQGGSKTVASTSVSITGLTTTVVDTLIVQAVSDDLDNAGAQFSAPTNAGLTGISERSDGGTTSGNGGGIAVWDGVKATAGSTGNTSATIASSTTNAFLTIALKPAPVVINSATLDGATSVTVGAGATMTAVVNATILAGGAWRSTGWRVAGAPGAMTCIDHADHTSAGTFNETFSATAPPSSGTYDAYFVAYNDNACSSAASGTFSMSGAVTILSVTEFNTTGGNTATNGLHFYLEDTTKIQVRRLNNTGQVYAAGATPPNNNLDNGVFIRANGLVYGPSHTVTTFNPTGGMFDNYSITPALPPNPSSVGVQQTATGDFGVSAGPQVSVLWKYTTPLDFLTAEVTLTIPGGYTVSAANPVRYYHVFDTYLGGSDNGCGFTFIDSNGKRIVGTYQPTSGSCTTSTSIPAGVNVVESFRERSGLTFSNYCASGWSSFFVNGSTNCSVLQSAVMSNAITASYIDTGIGIELDFTAPGTYAFSYDFVIGSPNVPPYDHLEIRHDGSGSLCPETVTVLACTSSTVPCPALSIVNTGTLTGTLTTSPAAPSITKTPTPFSVGTANSTQGVVLQSSGSGTVTLGTTGLSTTPLNGTKCWNTTTLSQDCSLEFASTPCVGGYECLETGATYKNRVVTPTDRNPLYTKLSGTNFKFDVVALQSSGVVATTYTAPANVTVELFDDSVSPTPACSAYTGALASQAITFAAGDLGRKTLSANFNLANAYAKVRCRVTDTNISPTLYGCSSDDFSVRPQQFTVTTPTLTNAALTGTPKAFAGTAFTLDAVAGVTSGYTGTPALITTKVQDHANVNIETGTLSGSFSAGTGPKASGTAFKYLDVGSIKLLVDAVVDSGFTSVDQVGDCVAGSTSNTLAGGQYGCNVGSAASSTMGRWHPSHYSFAGSLTSACALGGFTYMDQDALGVMLTLKAHASTGAAAAATDPVVSRYTTGYTNLSSVTISGDNSGSAVAVTRLTNPAFPAMPNTALWNTGLFQISDTYAFSKLPAGPDGAYDLFKLMAGLTDPDGGSLIGAATAKETNATKIRYGRLQLQNAYGSEFLTLPVQMALQYWNGSWQKNTLDSCSAVLASQFAWSFPAGTAPRLNNLAACESFVSVAGAAPNYTVTLSAPGTGNAGWADLMLNLGAAATGASCTSATAGTAATANMPWLQHDWTGTGIANPRARATFGVFKSPLIYRRENY
nr:DUF6701 domain-containing protein [Rhodoferax sp.]